MAVAGEVSLGIIVVPSTKFIYEEVCLLIFDLMFLFFSSDEHDIDFHQFGILIKVKFRYLQLRTYFNFSNNAMT